MYGKPSVNKFIARIQRALSPWPKSIPAVIEEPSSLLPDTREAVLTGESMPVEKVAHVSLPGTPLLDRKNLCFMVGLCYAL